ncbi:MAG TPA: hypothetical protein VEB21_12545 [Terriglobales bacterium]|nr:hypothetical protein [Terriglobales bacterium]
MTYVENAQTLEDAARNRAELIDLDTLKCSGGDAAAQQAHHEYVEALEGTLKNAAILSKQVPGTLHNGPPGKTGAIRCR